MYENFHTKQHAHSARCTHACITQLYIMSIQPATKAAEHLVSSYKREREREEGIKRERERETVTQTQQRLAHREREREEGDHERQEGKGRERERGRGKAGRPAILRLSADRLTH